MKWIWLLLLISGLLQAEKVEVSADVFEADEVNMLATLTGHVTLKKGEDIIHANTLTIHFDAKNKPTEYIADGAVNFRILTNNQNFSGHANTLKYDPSTLQYAIIGNAFIHEKTQDRKLYGEHIMIDRRSGKSSIKGSKSRPVKFTFEVKE